MMDLKSNLLSSFRAVVLGTCCWLASQSAVFGAVGDVLSSLLPPDADPQGMTWDGASLWVSDNNSNFIFKLSTDGKIEDSFQVFNGLTDANEPVLVTTLYDLAWVTGSNGDPDRLWVTDGTNLHEIDPLDNTPADGNVTRTFTAPNLADYPGTGPKSQARGLASPGPGQLWLAEVDTTATTSAGTSVISLLNIDQFALEVVRSFPARGRRTLGLGWDGQRLWVSDALDKSLMQVDPQGNVRLRLTLTGDAPTGVTFDGEGVWVAKSGAQDLLVRYDVGNSNPTSEVSGRIFGADGVTPLQQATVRLLQSGWIRESKVTDSNGFYFFEGLSPLGPGAGAYSIQAFVLGSVGASQPLTIVQNQNVTNFNLTLGRANFGDKVDGVASLGFTPTGLAWLADQLWVLDDASDFLMEVDPATGLINRAYLQERSSWHDLTAAQNSLTLVSHFVMGNIITNVLNFIDPDSGQSIDSCAVPSVETPNTQFQARALAWNGDVFTVSLVDVSGDARLSRLLQLQSNCELVEQFVSPAYVTNGLEWEGERLWLTDNNEMQYLLDTRANVLGSFRIPNEAGQGSDTLGSTFGATSSWVAVNGTDQIWRFDNGTNASGLITGTIQRSGSTTPIGNARVRLYQNGRQFQTTAVNPDGSYQFEQLAPLGTNAGAYQVRASAPGFISAVQDVTVQPAQIATVSFQLNPSALGDTIDNFPSPSLLPNGTVQVADDLWVSDDEADFLFRMDPETGRILNSYVSPTTSNFDLTWNGTCLLLADGTQVRAIDPATGTSSASCPAIFCQAPGRRPSLRSLEFTGKGFLMGEIDPATSNPKMSIVTRTDSSCNPVDVGSFPAPNRGLQGIAWDSNSRAWISDDRADRLYRVDLFGNVLASFAAPSAGTRGLGIDENTLVLADSTRQEIALLDSALGSSLGTISGTVYQTDGATRIPGALVRLLHNGRVSNSTFTLNDGTFVLQQVPLLGSRAGSYTLQASAPGYILKEVVTTLVAGGNTVDVPINLAVATKGGVVSRIPAPSFLPSGLAWDGAKLWVGDDDGNFLTRLDPLTGFVDRVFPAPGETVFDLAWDDVSEKLWVVGANAITRINPLDGIAETNFPAPAGGEDVPHGLTWDGANLWVSETDTTFAQSSIISKLDTSGNIVAGSSFPSPGRRTFGLAWDGTGFWAADKGADRVYQLSANGNQLSFIATSSTEPEGATFDGDFLWVADSNTDSLHRMDVDLACVPLNPFSANLFVNPVCGPTTLTLATNPDACAGGTIELESSEPSVATVQDGIVTAVNEGEARITARCSKKKTCSTFVAVRVFDGPCPTATATRTATPVTGTPTRTPTVTRTGTPTRTRTPGATPVPTGGQGSQLVLVLGLALALLASGLRKGTARQD